MIILSKSNRHIAREITEKDLQTEYAKGLLDVVKIFQHKDVKGQTPQENYHQLLKNGVNIDKHNARR